MRKINIRGKEFHVTENQNAFWDNVESGKWEPETFEVLEEFCKDGKTFVDIGAWNGVCSMYAYALGCDVETVEPDKAILNTLEANLFANSNRYNVWNYAISDSDGFVNLKSQTSFGDSMSSIVDRSHETASNSVRCITLERFFTEWQIEIKEVCLIKVDIEGGEVLVLKKAKEFLAKHKPTMYISLHPAWFPNQREDLQMIIDVIFPIYKVCRMLDGVLVQFSRDKFLKEVENGGHSFILIAK